VEGYRSGDLRQEKVIITITFYAVQEDWKQNKTPHVDKDSSIACADAVHYPNVSAAGGTDYCLYCPFSAL